MKFIVGLADKYIEINSVYDALRNFFKDYLVTDVTPDFSVSLNQEDISAEQEVTSENQFSPTYLETLALLRKLAEILPSHNRILMHGASISYNEHAYLFTAPSGTGKSTHTRLWYQNIPDAKLLNDDSPIVRYIDNKLWVYGSPWSGKTACYKNEKYEIAAIVRLSQAPSNHIKRLSTLESYGALHPSFPPGFAYDNTLYEHIGNIIGECLTHTPVFHLQCLPNVDAALLCKNTIYKI